MGSREKLDGFHAFLPFSLLYIVFYSTVLPLFNLET